MNIKKLILLVAVALTVCLNLDAFRRARVATRRGAIAGGHRYYGGVGAPARYGVGAGLAAGAIAGTALVAAAQDTEAPEFLES